MNYQRTIIWCLGLLLIMTSCASPQKSFTKGNYEKAFSQALKNLKKGSKNRKDKTILNSSFEEILRSKKEIIANKNSTSFIEDWELAYAEYDDITRYYEDGRPYLPAKLATDMEMLKEERIKLKKELSDNYYQLGEDSYAAYEETRHKVDAQDAYRYYDKALYYGSTQNSIDSKMDQAWEWGSVNILVIVDQRFGFSYDWDIDREFSQIERRSRGFEVISYEKNEDKADCILEVTLADPNRDVQDSRYSENFSERIEDGYDTTVDTSGNTTRVPKYITVTGTVITIREDITFYWAARVQPSGDRNLCDYRSREIEAQERVTIDRYEWSGDSRAIPDRYKNNRTDVPREEDVIDDLIEELYDEFVRYYFQ